MNVALPKSLNRSHGFMHPFTPLHALHSLLETLGYPLSWRMGPHLHILAGWCIETGDFRDQKAYLDVYGLNKASPFQVVLRNDK